MSSAVGKKIAGIRPGEDPPVNEEKKKERRTYLLARGLMPCQKRWSQGECFQIQK